MRMILLSLLIGVGFTSSQEIIAPYHTASSDSLSFEDSISIFNTATVGGGLTTLLQGSDGYWRLKLMLPEIIALPNGVTYVWNGQGWIREGSTLEYLFGWRYR